MSINPSTRHTTQVIPTDISDAATLGLKLTPSGPEVGGSILDTATAVLAFTPSVVYQDTLVEAFKLIPSGLDLFPNIDYLDANTELFHFTPLSDEHYCPLKPEFEGELDGRWNSTEAPRWPATANRRWDSIFLGAGEGRAC